MSLLIVAKDEAVSFKRRSEKSGISLRYFGQKSNYPDTKAQALTVSLHNRLLGAHFHPVDQFQVIIGAPEAEYENRPFTGRSVHYADAYSPYGPLLGKEEPMRFFTLRAEISDLKAFMPEARSQLKWRGKRTIHSHIKPITAGDLPESGDVSVEKLIERDHDGLEALSIVAGPGAVINLSSPADTTGQIVFVADGAIEHDGHSYGVESVGWQDPGTETVQVTAGTEGTRVFVLRFPSPTTVVQHERQTQTASV